MVPAYYLLKLPYTLAWHIKHRLGKTEDVVLYCANTLDYQIFAPIQKYLKPLPVVAKNRKVQQELVSIGVTASRLPSFPEGVIMCRQAAYRFPATSIKKIGLRHGAYHFKPFANPDSYNLLNRFFMTSSTEVKQAEDAGIHCGVAIGYPKLDPAFDGSIDANTLAVTRQNLKLDANKKTILFTATWDKSGLSAISQWAHKLTPLAQRYNVLVTVHPWTATEHIDNIRNTPGVHYLGSHDILPHIMIADVCIGDASSILAECCALDKPMITFKMPEGKRTVPHVHKMIRNFSLQIEHVNALDEAIQQCLATPDAKQSQRAEANHIMFDQLDGLAGKRAADEIITLFPQLKLN
ncbi:MAG: CDP-glycerol glycerophosphotransferase family protein [Gammaproteobacteria bacterium]|nr:CDP-glycerol glycerophosphotransferase family protein [Gammaproteobacteria bacterium]MCF6258742.1 CDP-glycerol glycerophosphotransferase family protein [Gammaproteobacteria bacterium]